MTLRGDNIASEFHQIVENYIEKRFGREQRRRDRLSQQQHG